MSTKEVKEEFIDDTDLDSDEEYFQSDTVTLPVGIEKDGQRYRQVVIDEMSGVDDHLVAKKSGGNGARAVTIVLARCIQEIEGLVERKSDEEKLIDRSITRNMVQVDRDFLISRIHMLAGKDDMTMAGECPRCGRIYEEYGKYHLLPVISWPDDKPLEIPFELEVGVPETKKSGKTFHKNGIIRFPTGVDQEKVAGMEDSPAITTSMIAACVKNLGSFSRITQEQAKRLKSRDRLSLSLTLQRKLPGLRLWKEVECRCGRKFDIKVDITAFFSQSGNKGKK